MERKGGPPTDQSLLKHLLRLVEGSFDAVLVVDDAMCIVGANSAASRLTGYRPDELSGRSLDILMPPPVEDTMLHAWRRLLGGDIVEEHVFVDRDGSPILAEVQAMKDVLPGTHLVVLHDIGRFKATEAELATRVDQQAAVARLGQRALGLGVDELFGEVARVVSESLAVEFVSVLQLTESKEEFDVRSGIGWHDGVVGKLRIPAGAGSLPGFTLATGEPVVVEDVSTETRFAFTPVISAHRVSSAMTVVVGNPALPWGVLAAATSTRRSFSEHDASFLQSVANVLAAAIERADRETALRAAEREYRELVEGSPVGIIRIKLSGELILCNAAMLKIFGYNSVDELAAVIADQMRHPPPEYLELADQILSQGSLAGLEVETTRRDGSPVWIAVGARAVAHPDGEQAFEAVISDITASRAAKAGLEASEERFRLITELMSDYAFWFEFDEAGELNLIWLTGSIVRDFGYEPDDLSPLALANLTHPDDLEEAMEKLADIASGKTVEIIARFRRGDGEYRWMQTSARPTVDPMTGTVTGLVAAAKDITVQREAEDALRLSEERLRYVLSATPAVVFTFDAATPWQLSFVGENALAGLGYEPALCTRPGFLKATVHEEDWIPLEGAWEMLLRDHHYAREIRFQRGDGSWHWLRTEVALTTDSHGEPLEGVGYFVDVTERRRAEDEARAGDERLRLVLGQLPVILWTADDELRVTAMLGAGLASIGITEASILGGRFSDAANDPEAAAVGSAARRALAGEVITDDLVWRERTWRTRVEPLRDAGGTIRGVTGISFDVTEVVKAKQDLEVTVRALRRSDERRGHLLTRVVTAQEEERLRIARELHDDLGQRLTSAALFASALEQQWPAEHPQAANVFTLRRLVEEAMASTRSLVWNLRPRELDDLGLPAAIRRLASEVSSGNAIDVDVHATEIERLQPEVETTIYRIVQEALTNAVRHSGASSVSIVLGSRDEQVVAIVEDNGKGFDLFGVLERGPDTKRLGLIGMHERADSLGGTLLIETGHGSGVTVRLEAPLATRVPA